MVGYIVLSTPKSSEIGMIKTVVVKPIYQGRGIGTALLHQGIKRLKELNFSSIIISDVLYSNNKALELYFRIGFSIIQESKYTFYSLGESLLLSEI